MESTGEVDGQSNTRWYKTWPSIDRVGTGRPRWLKRRPRRSATLAAGPPGHRPRCHHRNLDCWDFLLLRIRSSVAVLLCGADQSTDEHSAVQTWISDQVGRPIQNMHGSGRPAGRVVSKILELRGRNCLLILEHSWTTKYKIPVLKNSC